MQEFESIGLEYDIGSIGKPIIFPTNFKYPICSEESMKALFTLLDLDKIIQLFECVLLERKINLISSHISALGMVVEALTALIFPFEFTSILIPVLPDGLRSYIEAPVPYLIGYSQ